MECFYSDLSLSPTYLLSQSFVYFSWNVKSESCSVVSDSWWFHGILQARKLEWVAFLFSRGIFPTQGSNPGLQHCRQIFYQLSHKESPRILDWVVYPFCRGSSRPRNWTGVSCIAGRFFTSWATREAQLWGKPNSCIFMPYFKL